MINFDNKLFLTLILVMLFYTACFTQNKQPTKNSSPTADTLLLPTRSGEYEVGRQSTYLTDNTRASDGKKREIPLWIYYPAEKSKDTEKESVLPAVWSEHYQTFMEKKLGKTAADQVLSLKTTARSNAPATSAKGNFPVLIFAPGANWLPTDYSSIIENAASSGYVVIAFASQPLSPFIQSTDGSFSDSPRVNESTYGTVGEDFIFVCDQLDKLNQDSSLMIKNRLDLNNIGAFGHSIGGAAALLAATKNGKIKTAINLDGDFGGDTQASQPAQSILYLTTQPTNIADGTPIEKWDEESNEIRRKGIWENVKAKSGAAFRVRVAGMFHSNFQDAALLSPGTIPDNLRRNRFGSINGERGVSLVSEIVIKFLNITLKNGSTTDFQAVKNKYPEIRIDN